MSNFDKWMARLNFLEKEYPFGPFRLIKNAEGRLHCNDGPAYISPTTCIWYKDGKIHGKKITIYGSVIYYYEDIVVPPNFVNFSGKLTIKDVFTNPNTEVRYVGVRIMGFEKIKNSKYCKIIHQDENINSELFSISEITQDPIVFVSVFNATPEITGERKQYFLQVPPTIATCKEAIAWTFGKDVSAYKPQIET